MSNDVAQLVGSEIDVGHRLMRSLEFDGKKRRRHARRIGDRVEAGRVKIWRTKPLPFDGVTLRTHAARQDETCGWARLLRRDFTAQKQTCEHAD